jgi:hypothetical protein
MHVLTVSGLKHCSVDCCCKNQQLPITSLNLPRALDYNLAGGSAGNMLTTAAAHAAAAAQSTPHSYQQQHQQRPTVASLLLLPLPGARLAHTRQTSNSITSSTSYCNLTARSPLLLEGF